MRVRQHRRPWQPAPNTIVDPRPGYGAPSPLIVESGEAVYCGYCGYCGLANCGHSQMRWTKP